MSGFKTYGQAYKRGVLTALRAIGRARAEARAEEQERILDLFRHERDTNDGIIHVAAIWAIDTIHPTIRPLVGDENE